MQGAGGGRFVAHSPPRANPALGPEALELHLRRVAQKAAALAEASRPGDREWEALARVAGLFHDLGKYRDEFQRYIVENGPEAPHSAYGAKAVWGFGVPPVLAIAGHHGGLRDLASVKDRIRSVPDDQVRLSLERASAEAIDLPPSPPAPGHIDRLSEEFRTRMLFSILVDADRLMTEMHDLGSERPSAALDAEACLRNLLARTADLERRPATTDAARAVQEHRRRVLDACLDRAGDAPGIFSLTVPTGGGKTLSGMAFALAHAARFSLRRVVVAIPFLSIIEQNAREYAALFGRGTVVEHHSAVVPADSEDEGCECRVLDVQTENWDAPILVTTTVQLVETLFGANPSRARKLHNLARSVVLLDEVQSLPLHLLDPLVHVIGELARNWGATVVLCSATQPGFRRGPSLPSGFDAGQVREIAPDPPAAFRALRRVRYEVRRPMLDLAGLAEELAGFPQVLCVVNLRRHAAELWQLLRDRLADEGKNSLFHLSSLMCAQHRFSALGDPSTPADGTIRARLREGLPCRVVSTQLVEAGVDLDFPVVYRALAPLDAIVQAAGRCNREGRLVDAEGRPALGLVRVFRTPDAGPRGWYRVGTERAAQALEVFTEEQLASDPSIFERYFEGLWSATQTDRHGPGELPLQRERELLAFRRVSDRAKVIEEDTAPVVVPWGEGAALIDALRASRFATREDLRQIQRYLVNVRRGRALDDAIGKGLLEPLLPKLELFTLCNRQSYSEDRGLILEALPSEAFVI